MDELEKNANFIDFFSSSLEHLSCDNHLNLRNLDNMPNEIQGWSKLTLRWNFVDKT